MGLQGRQLLLPMEWEWTACLTLMCWNSQLTSQQIVDIMVAGDDAGG